MPKTLWAQCNLCLAEGGRGGFVVVRCEYCGEPVCENCMMTTTCHESPSDAHLPALEIKPLLDADPSLESEEG